MIDPNGGGGRLFYFVPLFVRNSNGKIFISILFYVMLKLNSN